MKRGFHRPQSFLQVTHGRNDRLELARMSLVKLQSSYSSDRDIKIPLDEMSGVLYSFSHDQSCSHPHTNSSVNRSARRSRFLVYSRVHDEHLFFAHFCAVKSH